MFDWYKNDINFRLKNKNHENVIIGLGDSFTQGAGACSNFLWEKCGWDINKIPTNKLINYQIEYYNNSWVNQLSTNHLKDYVSVNMGMIGRGNRAAASELFLHPDLELEKVKNKIVIFLLTGTERFDMVHKEYNEHLHFKTLWPTDSSKEADRNLWAAYGETGYSEKMAVIETLLSVKLVKTWCELNNAKLIISSAFRPEYDRDFFIDKIRGSSDDKENYLYHRIDYIKSLVDYIDWENFLRPNNYKCFSDYLCVLEEREDLIKEGNDFGYYQYARTFEKMSPKGFITNCAHPSIEGHKKIAEVMYNHIKKLNYV